MFSAKSTYPTIELPLHMLRAAAKAASKDETRHQICGVHLRAVSSRELHVVGTDGMVMVHCRHEPAPSNPDLPGWLKESGKTIALENLEAMLGMILKLNGGHMVRVGMGEDGSCIISDNLGLATFRTEFVPAEYPDYQRVLSSDALSDAAADGVRFDTKAIKVAMDVAKIVKQSFDLDEQSFMLMASANATNAITFDVANILMIAMPKRALTMTEDMRKTLAPVTTGSVAALKAHRTRVQKSLAEGQITEAEAKTKLAEYDARIADILSRFATKALEDKSAAKPAPKPAVSGEAAPAPGTKPTPKPADKAAQSGGPKPSPEHRTSVKPAIGTRTADRPAKPEASKPEAKPEASKPAAKPETKPADKAASQSKAAPEAKPQTGTAKPEPKPAAQAAAKAEAKPDAKADSKPADKPAEKAAATGNGKARKAA